MYILHLALNISDVVFDARLPFSALGRLLADGMAKRREGRWKKTPCKSFGIGRE